MIAAYSSIFCELIIVLSYLSVAILGYQDPEQGRWFDINPILIDDLERWRAANA